MSIATGRDSQAYTLLQNNPPSVHIKIPSICCMEALYTLENELKGRNRFADELSKQISQLRRDVTSTHAQTLLYLLKQSQIQNQALLNTIQERLFQALEAVYLKVEMINLTPNTLQNSLNNPLVEKDLTDNLILHCILADARSFPTETKVLLSENTKDFTLLEVQEALREAGVSQYFSRTQNFLGWLQSQIS